MSTKQYRPSKDLTKNNLMNLNFKFYDGCYSYRFPVYTSKKYKNETLLWGILNIDLENSTCTINVVTPNNITYASYYDRTYGGENMVVKKIDASIKSKMNEFVKSNILEKN